MSPHIEEDFIIGHDDTPDYNLDHTQYSHEQHSFDHFSPPHSQFTVQDTPTYNDEQINEDVSNEDDDFLNNFIQHNMNSFSKYQETLQPQPQAPAPAAAPVSQVSLAPAAAAAAEEDSDDTDPTLREFTLLVSKLLFHLSQM